MYTFGFIALLMTWLLLGSKGGRKDKYKKYQKKEKGKKEEKQPLLSENSSENSSSIVHALPSLSSSLDKGKGVVEELEYSPVSYKNSYKGVVLFTPAKSRASSSSYVRPPPKLASSSQLDSKTALHALKHFFRKAESSSRPVSVPACDLFDKLDARFEELMEAQRTSKNFSKKDEEELEVTREKLFRMTNQIHGNRLVVDLHYLPLQRAMNIFKAHLIICYGLNVITSLEVILWQGEKNRGS